MRRHFFPRLTHAVSVVLVLVSMLGVTADDAQAQATFGYPTFVDLDLTADNYADTAVTELRPFPGADPNAYPSFPPGPEWSEVFDFETSLDGGFGVGPDTFALDGIETLPSTVDLGQAVQISGEAAEDDNLDFAYPIVTTSASAVGVVAVNGVGTGGLVLNWRVATINDNEQEGAGAYFITESQANIDMLYVVPINDVAPGTPVTISYEWEVYFTAQGELDSEDQFEDVERASSELLLDDDQDTGPGSVLFFEANEFAPTPNVGLEDDDEDSWTFIASGDPYVTINLAALSETIMEFPGDGPLEDDLGGSEFEGRLVLIVEAVPEPTTLGLMAWAAMCLIAWRRRT